MVAASNAPAAAGGASKPAQPQAPAKKSEVQKYLEKLQWSRKEAIRVSRWAAACLAALAEAKRPEAEQQPLKKLTALLDGAEGSIFQAAEGIVAALVEARWKAPQVKVAAGGGVVFAEGAPVTFRAKYLRWGVDCGVFTEAEAKSLVVLRIHKGKGGVPWITVKAEKTENHFGPYRAGDKLIAR